MKIRKAWLLVPGEEPKRIESIEGKEMDFKTMYPLIGCSTIEHVGLGKGVDMWCDEEGLFASPAIINPRASKLYQNAFPHIDPRELGIVGTAIVTDNTKAGAFQV